MSTIFFSKNYKIGIHPGDETGWFEALTSNESCYDEGVLMFKEKILYDYDGVFRLDYEIIDALKEQGFLVADFIDDREDDVKYPIEKTQIEIYIDMLRDGKFLTSDRFNQPDFEYLQYDLFKENHIRFIKRCGYNEPYDIKEDDVLREVNLKTKILNEGVENVLCTDK